MAITKQQDVTPLLDIQNPNLADSYWLGVHWAMYGDEQGDGPQPDTYLIENITRYIEQGRFHGLTDPLLPSLGFILGMVHDGILDPQTDTLRPNLTSLVILSNPDVIHGYYAGRRWFFVDSGSDEERHLTDTMVMQRLAELANPKYPHDDKQACINFSIGNILGELSGHFFPWTVQEQEQLDQDSLQFLGKVEPLPQQALACKMACKAILLNF